MPTNWRRREEQRKEAEAIGRFNDEVLGPLLGFVPDDPFKTTPKPKLPCQRPNCNDPECGRTFSHETDDAEVARCACGAIFYSTDAAHDHECPLDSEESEEVQ